MAKKGFISKVQDFIYLFKDRIFTVGIGILLVGILLGGVYYMMSSPQSIYSANTNDFPYEKKVIVQKITNSERIRYSRMGNQVETASWKIYWRDQNHNLDSIIIYRTHINLQEIIFLENLKPNDTIKVKYKDKNDNLVILKSGPYNNTYTHK